MIDAKFVDFLGQWKHLTYPIERLQEGLEEGFGFDGSSVAGWRAINSSDMLMKPDPTTAIMDPFLKTPTLSILCDVIDPITHESYSRDPRSLAKRAVAYLKSTGIADTAYFGPEAEFFIFDSIQYSEDPQHSFFQVDSDEAGWNNKRVEGGGNKGFKPPTKGGYCVAGPTDQLTDLRTQMVMTMQAVAICAFANPTTNSYRRLVPGYEAPVNLAYSARNRSASIRIPMYSSSPKAKRLELRSPDPSCNPYLAFAAMMMAGLDGIENRIHPGDPLDKDIYSLSPEELAEVPHVPGSLDEALDNLRKDRAFLMKGDVFSSDLLDAWIAYKTENESDHVRLRPVPAEFQLYYDC